MPPTHKQFTGMIGDAPSARDQKSFSKKLLLFCCLLGTIVSFSHMNAYRTKAKYSKNKEAWNKIAKKYSARCGCCRRRVSSL